MKNKKTVRIDEKFRSLVDIVAGPMKLIDLNNELVRIMQHRSPEYLVMTIQKDKKIKKYYTTIYISKEDFSKYKP
jgi:hypothetical protein